MDLASLGLDRNLYRSNGDDPSYVNYDYQQYLSADNSSQTGVTDTSNPLGQGPGAPGTTVSQAIVRSSASANRIEIDPDDTLKIYSNVAGSPPDGVVVLITGAQTLPGGPIGVFVRSPAILSADDAIIEDIVTDSIELGPGTFVQIFYAGLVSGSGVISASSVNPTPFTWTCVRTGAGQYTITHNLHRPSPFLNLFVNVNTSGLTVAAANVDGDNFIVGITDLTGTFVDNQFNFLAF